MRSFLSFPRRRVGTRQYVIVATQNTPHELTTQIKPTLDEISLFYNYPQKDLFALDNSYRINLIFHVNFNFIV